MTKLNTMRQEIDAIDDQLIKLLQKRFDLSSEIGRLKKATAVQILDSNRESEILQKIPDSIYHDALKEIYLLLFSLSKKHQEMV